MSTAIALNVIEIINNKSDVRTGLQQINDLYGAAFCNEFQRAWNKLSSSKDANGQVIGDCLAWAILSRNVNNNNLDNVWQFTQRPDLRFVVSRHMATEWGIPLP